jgi:hypothetical protein
MLRARAVLICSLALPALGCNELDNFRTRPHEVYSGDIVGSDTDQDKDSFIRQGFPSHTKLDLTFDPALASLSVPVDAGAGAPPSPGTIHTFVCPPAHPDCSAKSGTSSLFVHADLEQIKDLNHDVLAQYDFPGGGRLRNYMFFARTYTGTSARAPMVFVSLMDNDRVEVRVIGPSVLGSDGKTEIEPALFGLFLLKRHTL